MSRSQSIAVTKDSGILSSIEIDESAFAKSVEEAVVAEEKYGVNSDESKVLWSIVDEIENSNNNAARMGSLEEECLLSASEACEKFGEAMQELNKVIGRERIEYL